MDCDYYESYLLQKLIIEKLCDHIKNIDNSYDWVKDDLNKSSLEDLRDSITSATAYAKNHSKS